jgi:transglutaminase/protease-like cytokinesis protein 3
MTSASTSAYSNPSQGSSNSSNSGAVADRKPAKLAIQSPSGKIIRLMRKSDHMISDRERGEGIDGGIWETVVKVGERGTWRALVLADRTARWCVFGEWECI